MRKLTDKQAAFCREYLIDLNATQAAIRAGYSAKTAEVIGYQQLQKTSVHAEIQRLMDKRAKRTDITADYVLTTIKETVDRCRQEIRPIFDKSGEQIMIADKDGNLNLAYEFDSRGVLKGCELLGKHLKLFTDKVEFPDENGKPQAITQFTNFPPEPKTMEEWEAMVHGKKTDKTGD